MNLTPKSLHTEMRNPFAETDPILQKINERFDRLPGDIVAALSPYFANIEKMLSNHEDRITVLEKRH
jgi:hypothetical protein